MSAETNAERLERIKNKTGGIYSMESESVESKDVPVEDFDWLIEQAEENARLRKALEFYADEGNYVLWNGMAMSQKEIERDKGNKAKTALEGE